MNPALPVPPSPAPVPPPPPPPPPPPAPPTVKDRRLVFLYKRKKLDDLQKYLETAIRGYDEHYHKYKQYMITIWAGGLALLISQKGLSGDVLLTALVPVFFWFAAARSRGIQGRFIYRGNRIWDYLNTKYQADFDRLEWTFP